MLKPGGWLVLSTPNQLSAPEHPVSDCQRTIRGVPGRVLSGSPNRAFAQSISSRIAGECGSVADPLGLLVRRPDSAGRTSTIRGRCRECSPRRFPTTWCSLPARMRDRPTVVGVEPRRLLIRRLPAGRYQMADALARFAGEPFLAYLPADLGRLELCLRSARHHLSRSVLHRKVPAAGDADCSTPSRSRHGRRRRRRQLGLFSRWSLRISSVE